MSTANISQLIPDVGLGGGGTVVFATRDGGTRSYHYGAQAFAAISNGDDPRGYSSDGNGSGSTMADLAGDMLEIILESEL